MARKIVLLTIAALLAGSAGAPPVHAAPRPAPAAEADAGPTVYVGQLTTQQLAKLSVVGVDRHEIGATVGGVRGRTSVEVVLTSAQAAKLRAAGVGLKEKSVAGTPVSQRLEAESAAGNTVFRSYSEPGGIRDELIAVARQYPRLTKLVSIGKSVRGQNILAIKVTKNATRVRDGRRPSVLYSSAQHAREWITPEMNRRLLRYYLQQYARNRTIRRVVNSTELWFLPVANPDGYDYTFTEGNRLWRKNLRDNNGDGAITEFDGVDLNRNFPVHWGYDNEGSSPSIGSDTYRGTAPASEPETRALNRLMRRVRFEFQVNYHSAAELLLYGVGWQVATPTPDDLLYETLAGNDARPAVAGYDPDISAELYTTNGETTEHAHQRYGTLAFTPEMSTCQTASATDPNDAFRPEDCESVFNFPDSEALIQAEFQKNIPFALAVARSAKDPSNPVSVVGRKAPDFSVDRFRVSYGDPQTVAVTARRDLRRLRLRYSVDGRRPVTARVREWRGGERYGDQGDRYYAEFRGTVRGARPGDRVTVWFTGRRPGKGLRRSRPFTYVLRQDARSSVLVVANEDYEGVNPVYPPSVTRPKYAAAYVAALRRKGYKASVWDVSRQGVPHSLGVLRHFKAVLWYLGDNRLTQDPEDELTRVGDEDVRDAAVAGRQQYLTLSVRDHLNEHGKLLHTGETAGYFGTFGSTVGGIYYGLDGAPAEDCVVTQDLFSDCLLLADDFYQYYLGAFSRLTSESPKGFTGAGRLRRASGTFGGRAVADNPLDEPGAFLATSEILPAAQFPQFRSRAGGRYTGAASGQFDPVQGTNYVGGPHLDDSYTRLSRTIDLRTATAAQNPQLQAQLSFDTEPGYDNVIVEAHPVGSDDWTTLSEAGGLTTTDVPPECEAGFLLEEHPFLLHYLTPGEEACTPTGTTGAWNAMTGSSDGWKQATFDLSAYAGQQVEVAISYVTDPSSGGVGAFVDDTKVVVDGVVRESEGFETGLGPWTVAGPPTGSPPGGAHFRRAPGLFVGAVTTADSVLFGFGLEHIASRGQRADVIGEAMRSLLPR
ncbi:MAG TPA: M14 family zinc carboxypeptidase [Nocardioidaceae bacterium]|nr:M14 family zinc carboxypeptidase [Nocardioidaceae bacterium]